MLAGSAAFGCAGLLGVDDEQSEAASAFCACDGAAPKFGSENACVKEMTHRLETATPNTRTKWMQAFDKYCRKSCTGCWDNMFQVSPTCTEQNDDCAIDQCSDCCNPTASGAGQCA